MRIRLLALLIAVGAVAALNGCGDSTGIRAQFPNTDRPNVTVYALNGTPPALPSAVQMRSTLARVIDGSFAFDIAFDLNAAGDVIAYPVRRVASQFVQAHPVGFQLSNETFAAATRAPISGYVYDSTLVLPVGKTLYVDVIDASCSNFSLLGQNIRGKIVVDSVIKSSRIIYLHLFSNPNCGFRSLLPGDDLPKD
jgi:hypothetical protein